MSKISNVFTMLELLSNGKKYTIKELADRLEVTERMIRVYKDELEYAGIYINTIRGKYGGYILDRNKVLPSRGFSKYDLALLNNVYNMIKTKKEFKLNKEYLNLIDKIEGVYKSTKKKSSKNLLTTNDEKNKYNALNRAKQEKKKVLINFLSADGTAKERVIHPCDMFLYDDSWYISAFCELRNEIRHFRLERILEYNLLEENYN
jgi:predicted DNA-binding transcriptional regulator YafY